MYLQYFYYISFFIFIQHSSRYLCQKQFSLSGKNSSRQQKDSHREDLLPMAVFNP